MSLAPIRIGGLYRCCIEQLAQHAADGGSEAEGTRVVCRHCGETVIVRDGAWRWEPGTTVQP